MDETVEYDPATAYHEAGHAVVAMAMGRPVHRVSVLPNRDRLGQCEFGKAVFRPSEDWVEREVMISLGGLAAEARHTGTYGWGEAERDLRHVRKLLEQTTARAAARLEKRMLAKVENLLADDGHWRAVERLAAELLVHGVISGRAARHLYDQAVGSPHPSPAAPTAPASATPSSPSSPRCRVGRRSDAAPRPPR